MARRVREDAACTSRHGGTSVMPLRAETAEEEIKQMMREMPFDVMEALAEEERSSSTKHSEPCGLAGDDESDISELTSKPSVRTPMRTEMAT
mmetsp:Transcript_2707/g.10546  ORF Transcript_2707/g.10546 Transcript_2707/m.10546 type:complete len:92 (-) Transcript_2707:287-562(-)